MMKLRFLTTTAAALMLCACAAKAPDDRVLALRSDSLFTLGVDDAQPGEAFASVPAVAFDASERLYVVDGRNGRVAVFDSTGRWLRDVGRKGNGPGELAHPVGVAVLPGGRVVVSDVQAARYTVFDSAGARLGETAFDARWGVPGMKIQPAADGAGVLTIALPLPILPAAQDAAREGSTWLLRQPIGGAAAPVRLYRAPATWKPRDGQMGNPPAFHPTVRWAALPGGGAAVASGVAYEIRLLGPRGDSVRTVGRAFEPRKVTRADRERERDEVRKAWSTPGMRVGPGTGQPPRAFIEQQVRGMRFEKRVPVIARLAADPARRLWVQREAAGQDGPVDLLASDGRYLGTLRGERVPDAFSPGGRAAYIVEDEDGTSRVEVRRVPRIP